MALQLAVQSRDIRESMATGGFGWRARFRPCSTGTVWSASR